MNRLLDLTIKAQSSLIQRNFKQSAMYLEIMREILEK